MEIIVKKLIIGIVVILGIPCISHTLNGASHNAETSSSAIIQNWENNYTGFEENLGQVTDFENNPVSSVLFRLNLPEYNIFLTENGVSFILYQYEKEKDLINFARFDIEPVDGKIEKSKIELSNEISGYNNYYLSHCPDGILSVKSYRYIKINDLFPGIDWVLRYDDKVHPTLAGKSGVHNEFIVKPNADISRIKLNVKWADIEIKDGKELTYSTPLGKIKEGEIYVYEKEGGNVSAVYKKDVMRSTIEHKRDEQGFITFDIKEYDKNKTLIIDPPFERLWATYYGGTGQDNCDGSREMGAITADNSGNIFVTGFSLSTNFPTYNPGGGNYFQGNNAGTMDAFILKFSNTGAREWATYYGGSADEMGISIATDDSSNVFVTGNTFSTNFPTYNPGGGAYYQTSGGNGDVFILKFSDAGIREWATCYGGSSSDVGYSIATDNSGNVFVTGNTFSSTNFPTYDAGGGAYFQGTNAGSFDAFILKFTNTGVRQWATYYGGTDDDNGYSIATDTSGNIFLTGMTRSTNFPIYDPGGGAYYQTSILGYRTVFMLKFSNTGVRGWATYYGGSTNDYGRSIATDGSGKIFVTGNTSSTNFPTFDPGGGAYFQGSNAGSDDAFILKFSNTGARERATYYGGTTGDIGRSITTDDSGNVFVTGNTLSSNFPTFNPGSGAYYQAALTGGHEAFILGFSNTGARQWATYYGGSSTDYGMSIITDASDNIFLTGFTLSSSFPTYNPGGSAYFQGTNAGSYDAYILKFASSSTGIEDNRHMLSANPISLNAEPNPAKSFTVIRYSLPIAEKLSLQIFDISGKLVKNLVNEFQSSGVHNLIWNGKDEYERRVVDGVYFYMLETPTQKFTRKLIFTR